jgi:hypothetical protein
MKKYINVLLSGLLLTVGFPACNEEDYSSREYYKYVVYLISKEDYNVYTDVFPFDDGNEVTGYFSIGCGGSLSNPEEIIVDLEPDTVLLNLYNRSNFDIDTSKYARMLSEDRYRIETYRAVFPANNSDQYVKVAVSVNPDGLSPDSTYFIPLSIKSVSAYEVNPEKYNMLFRVALENYYAEQKTVTYYQMKGNILNAAGEITGGLSSTKPANPVSKNSIRIFAGGEIQDIKTTTVADIERLAVTLTVDANSHVLISPYKSIEVEQYDGEKWNTYEEVRNNMVDDTVTKYFYLRYRYRTVRTPATATAAAVYNSWIIVQETLKRLE